MYTKDDYFAYGEVGDSPCGIRQQSDIDWLSDEFDRFLKSIMRHRTFNSEWYYNCHHSGIHAVTDYTFEPRKCDEDNMSSDLRDLWNGRVSRMVALREFIDNRENHLNDAPFIWYGGYVRRRDDRYQKELDIAVSTYDKFVDDTLEDLCDLYERNLQETCEWCETDEAANEWVKFMNS